MSISTEPGGSANSPIQFKSGSRHVEIDGKYVTLRATVEGEFYGLPLTLVIEKDLAQFQDEEDTYRMIWSPNSHRGFGSSEGMTEGELQITLRGLISVTLATLNLPAAPLEENQKIANMRLSTELAGRFRAWADDLFQELEREADHANAISASSTKEGANVGVLNVTLNSIAIRVPKYVCRSEEEARAKPFAFEARWRHSSLPNVSLNLEGAVGQSAVEIQARRSEAGFFALDVAKAGGGLDSNDSTQRRPRPARAKPPELIFEGLRSELEVLLLSLPVGIDMLTANVMSDMLATPIFKWLDSNTTEILEAEIGNDPKSAITDDQRRVVFEKTQGLQATADALCGELNSIFHAAVSGV